MGKGLARRPARIYLQQKNMNKIDFSRLKKVHLIGIGGIGISALARLLLSEGKKVSGTNDSESPETLDELRAKGVEISLDLEPSRLPQAEC